MAEQIQTGSLAAPGFLGINLQESAVSLSSGYALTAMNCIIDKYGRIGARKGWVPVNDYYSVLGSDPIEFMFELVDADGNQVISAGGEKLFSGLTSLTEKTVRNNPNTEDLAYTITANNWQAAALPFGDQSDATPHAYVVQANHEALVYHKLPEPGFGCEIIVSTVGGSGEILTLTISDAGEGYAVGDVIDAIFETGVGINARFTVATVNVTGGVTSVTITNGGTGYAASDVLQTEVISTSAAHVHEGSYGFQRLADVGSLPAGYTVSTFKPNCVLAAYGRIWMADIVGDRQTVYFSRLLDGSDFAGGDSGFLSLNEIFPNNDQIIGLAAHNGFLIIFGRNNIAIYGNPLDVTELTLAEYIPNVGCIARDSIQNTGSDIIFLSDGGVRSLQRVIQEKSLPMRDMSKNVRDDLMATVASEVATTIKSVYFERDALYLLSMPVTGIVYCFDMRAPLETGAARVTFWNNIKPRAFLVTDAKQLLLGQNGYIGRYQGYLDNGQVFRFQYFTNYFDFGAPTQEKILKQIGFILIGGSEQEVAIKWGFNYVSNYFAEAKKLDKGAISEYNIALFTDPYDNISDTSSQAYYSDGIVLDTFKIQAKGKGNVIQVGVEANINGSPLSIQRIDVYTKVGKTT